MLAGFLTGATYPFRAVNALRRSPRLLQYLLVPIAINIVIAIALYFGLLLPGWQAIAGLMLSLDRWLDGLIADLPQWLSVLDYAITALGWLLRVVLVVILSLAVGFIFLQFGTLLGSPWYGQLSEQVERYRLGTAEVVEVGLLQDLGRAVLFELKKLLLWGAIALPLLFLNLIPGVGALVISGGWIALTALIACLDFLDGPAERRRFPFRRKLKIVLRSLPASASFSVTCWLLISIPLLNLVTIPICVAAGTLFWCDRVLPVITQAASTSPEPPVTIPPSSTPSG
ncbi:MAG: hypothetical protein HC838_00680 [Spirulinaceae cyanobacterium RM2_2_10]|nr:hypothetical protein [Spirulinaceae cyanobacterium SM2_1_0]NJO18870.1 hypothetical protein [Spirulinaceae cyanobacterium RM2_2_10]